MSDQRKLSARSGESADATAATSTSTARFRVLMLLVTLIFAWILWSWMFEPLLLVLGLVSVLLVVYLVHRMDYFRSEFFGLRFNLRLAMYWLWLSQAIFRSSLHVARVILTPSLPISPRIVELDTGITDPAALSVLANSITLTPGTLSLYVRGDGIIEVQALTQEAADDLLTGEMTRRVAAIWRD